MMHILNILEIAALTWPTLTIIEPSLSHLYWRPAYLHLTISFSFLIGLMLCALGALMRFAAYHALGRDFTYHLGLRKEHSLVTHGIYSFVRHPSYTAFFVFFAGACVSQLGPGSLLASAMSNESAPSELRWAAWAYSAVYVTIVVYMLVSFVQRTPDEDQVLRAQYGEQWERWAERTKYRLCPYVY